MVYIHIPANATPLLSHRHACCCDSSPHATTIRLFHLSVTEPLPTADERAGSAIAPGHSSQGSTWACGWCKRLFSGIAAFWGARVMQLDTWCLHLGSQQPSLLSSDRYSSWMGFVLLFLSRHAAMMLLQLFCFHPFLLSSHGEGA